MKEHLKGLQVPSQWVEGIFRSGTDMNGNRPSHKNLGAKSGRRLRLIDHHLSLLRGKRFFEHNRSSRGAFEKMTNLRPSRIVFRIVILITDETRILGFVFGTFIDQRLRRVLLQQIRFILAFTPFLTFRSFLYRGGLDEINFGSFAGIRWGLRSIFFWSSRFFLRRGHRRLLGG